MCVKVGLFRKIQERMQNAAIGDVHFGSFHLALGNVLMPRLQLPNNQSRGQVIKVVANGRVSDPERAGQFG